MKKCKCEQRECKHHGMTEHALRSGGRWRCKKCGYEAVARRRRKLKRDLIEHHGGECVKCGYAGSPAALTFHHRNPEEKEFKISTSTVFGWDELLAESLKCDLVCLNCHAEIHNEAP
jgi:hypothetical protein